MAGLQTLLMWMKIVFCVFACISVAFQRDDGWTITVHILIFTPFKRLLTFPCCGMNKDRFFSILFILLVLQVFCVGAK